MRILHRYVFFDYLVIFFTTVFVNLFVMSMIVVVREMSNIDSVASPSLLLRLFVMVLPYLLMFALPISALTACLILFGRLSFDGEVTAMRASGLSMWNIIAPVLLFSVLLSLFCMVNNAYFAPASKANRDNIIQLIRGENPLDLLAAGRSNRSIPGYNIYIGSKKGNILETITISKFWKKGMELVVDAGRVEVYLDQGSKLWIDLKGVTIRQLAGPDENKVEPRAEFASYPYSFNLGGMDRKKKPKEIDAMTMTELLVAMRESGSRNPRADIKILKIERAEMAKEMKSRLALALSCFAFTLIGVPLGMKSRRKESSVGIGIALGLVLFYYMFIELSKKMLVHPEWRPDLIIWTPVLVCEFLGIFLLHRIK